MNNLKGWKLWLFLGLSVATAVPAVLHVFRDGFDGMVLFGFVGAAVICYSPWYLASLWTAWSEWVPRRRQDDEYRGWRPRRP